MDWKGITGGASVAQHVVATGLEYGAGTDLAAFVTI